MTRLRRVLAAAGLVLAASLAVRPLWAGVGGLLLLLAVAAAGAALWLEAGGHHADAHRWTRAARRLQAAAGTLLAAALAFLAAAFLRGDLAYAYVWSHTSTSLPWTYRLAGTWAGGTGTALLWAAVTSLALTRLLDEFEEDASAGLQAATHLLVGGFVLALAVFLVAEPPFAPTDQARLADPATANGAGLNELLITPLMVIHPPIQFLAYGLAALPGGLALAGLAAGTDSWLDPARRWGRRAWIAATAGLGLGALWAYYVLSFGGYWIWDPVETANVLPWVGLLAFLHAARDRDTSGGNRLAAPLLAVAAWTATVFASVAVRSGLWTSVHAFTDPTDVFEPDPGRRLLDILATHAGTAFFTGLALALVFLVVAAVLRRWGPDRVRSRHRHRALQVAVGLEAALAGIAFLAPRWVLALILEAGRRLVPAAPNAGFGLVLAGLVGLPLLLVGASLEDDPEPGAWTRLLRLGAVLLTLAGAVTLLLLLRAVNGAGPGFYDGRVPFVALPIVAAMTAMLAWHPLGPRRAVGLAAAGTAGAIVGALAFPEAWVLAGAVPSLAAAFAAGLARLRHQGRSPRRDPRREAAGGLLLAAGLLGVLTWSNPPSAVPLPGGLLPIPAALAYVLWPASLLALAGSLAAFKGGPRPLARAGGVAGTLAAGLGVGAFLGAAALALQARLPDGDVPWRTYAAAARPWAIHLAHVGALVGLLGWAASTYGGATAGFAAVPGGDPVDFQGMTLTLDEARGEPSPGGEGFAAVDVPVAVTDEGDLLDQGTLRLYRRMAPVSHYDPHVDVQRGPAADLVLHPQAFRTPADGWVEAHGNRTWMASDDVTKVRFTVESRPAMSLLWGGLSLVVAGSAGLVAAEARRREPL